MSLLSVPLKTGARVGDWMLNRIMPLQFLKAMSPYERALARLGLLMATFAFVVALVGPSVVGLTGAPSGKTIVVVLIVVPVIVTIVCLAGWGASIVFHGMQIGRRAK
jgi:hypothetical protein